MQKSSNFLLFCALIILGSFVVDAQSEYQVDAATVGLWHFDEGAGNIAVDETGMNNGTFSEAGKFGNALLFGLNNTVQIPHHASLNLYNYNFTLEAWIYYLGTFGSGVIDGILRKDNAYSLDLTDNGFGSTGNLVTALAVGCGGLCISNVPAPIGRWVHVAVTSADNVGLKFYVNGSLEQAMGGALPAISSSNLVFGGIENNQTTQYLSFNGMIDEIRISDVARNPSEFCLLNSCSDDSNTIGLWHFDEGVGSITNDSSLNGNNGTLIGATWVNPPAWVGVTPIIQGSTNALDLSGSKISMNDNPSLDLGSSLTLEAWIFFEPEGAMGKFPIVAKWDHRFGVNERSYVLYAENNQTGSSLNLKLNIAGVCNECLVKSNISIATGDWVHVAGTYDNSEMKLYINGNEVGNSFVSGTVTNSNAPLEIGSAVFDNSFSFFKGKIDEVRVSNIAREPPGFNISVNPVLQSCAPGNVNMGISALTSVLFVNDQGGSGNHVSTVSMNQPINISIESPPSTANIGGSYFIVYADLGEPSFSSIAPTPPLGNFCFNTPLTGGFPLTVFNTLGFYGELGVPVVTLPYVTRTPFSYYIPQGISFPVNVTLQGLVIDYAAQNGIFPISRTNAVILEVV